jgi:SAM-dependent methyltransferase
MNERVTEKAPMPILDLFLLPYLWIRNKKLPGSYLDIGCGKLLWGKNLLNAVSIDIQKTSAEMDIIADTVKLPFSGNSFDFVLCFETIEHIKKDKSAIEEILRVVSQVAWIGSVNKIGPDFICGIEIWKKKNNKNPFHEREYNPEEFKKLINSCPLAGSVNYYHSIYENDRYKIEEGLSREGYCNYAEIFRKEI